MKLLCHGTLRVNFQKKDVLPSRQLSHPLRSGQGWLNCNKRFSIDAFFSALVLFSLSTKRRVFLGIFFNISRFILHNFREPALFLKVVANQHVSFICLTHISENIISIVIIPAILQAFKVIPLKLFYYQNFFETWHS